MREPVFTSDWFSVRVPDWERVLAPIMGRPGLRCLEIGSYEGRSSLWIADHLCAGAGSYVRCVDTWEGSAEHTDAQKDGLYQRFLGNTKYHPKILPHRADSARFLALAVVTHANWTTSELATGSLYDFIFVDGSHKALDVLTDAVLALKLLASGGYLAFDDYAWSDMPREVDRPRMAIDAFLACAADEVEVLKKDFEVIVRRRS